VAVDLNGFTGVYYSSRCVVFLSLQMVPAQVLLRSSLTQTKWMRFVQIFFCVVQLLEF